MAYHPTEGGLSENPGDGFGEGGQKNENNWTSIWEYWGKGKRLRGDKKLKQPQG